MNIREATEKWVREFGEYSMEMLEALRRANTDSWREVTADGEEYDTFFPSWSTLWAFISNESDQKWLEDNIGAMSDCGFRIYKSDHFGYFFGIEGGGYDFYEEHWIPLYKARGLNWHDESMEVLLVKPGSAPQKITISDELSVLQNHVGGNIEVIYPYADRIGIICNGEGKINGLPLNRAIYGSDGQMIDIIAGNFIVAGLSEDNFKSLSPDLLKKYTTKFAHTESFINLNGEIISIKNAVNGKMN